jgi:uncharacterized protein (TIGR02452 family)
MGPAAVAHSHRRLVLGVWGCGVFRNDPATVAEAFAGALAKQSAHLSSRRYQRLIEHAQEHHPD